MPTNNSPGVSPYDLATPRRPITNDFNGAAKVDDAQYPPDPTTMPNAAEYNELCQLAVALGRVLPLLVISITGGTTPTVAAVVAPGSNIVAANLTITRNSAGDVSITWPATAIPAPAVGPVVSSNAGIWSDVDAVTIANGVRVRSWNGAGTPTDLSFTVEIR